MFKSQIVNDYVTALVLCNPSQIVGVAMDNYSPYTFIDETPKLQAIHSQATQEDDEAISAVADEYLYILRDRGDIDGLIKEFTDLDPSTVSTFWKP